MIGSELVSNRRGSRGGLLGWSLWWVWLHARLALLFEIYAKYCSSVIAKTVKSSQFAALSALEVV